MKNNTRNFLFSICLLMVIFIVSSCTETGQQSISVEDTIGASPEYENYENAFASLTNFLMTSDFKASKLRDVMLKNGYIAFDDIPQNMLVGISDASRYFALQRAHDDALDILDQKYDYLELDKEVRLEIQRVYGATPDFQTALD